MHTATSDLTSGEWMAWCGSGGSGGSGEAALVDPVLGDWRSGSKGALVRVAGHAVGSEGTGR